MTSARVCEWHRCPHGPGSLEGMRSTARYCTIECREGAKRDRKRAGAVGFKVNGEPAVERRPRPERAGTPELGSCAAATSRLVESLRADGHLEPLHAQAQAAVALALARAIDEGQSVSANAKELRSLLDELGRVGADPAATDPELAALERFAEAMAAPPTSPGERAA